MRGLLTFLFKGKVLQVDTVLRGGSPRPQHEKPDGLEASRFKLIYFFSWVLSIVLIVCLVGTIVLRLTGEQDNFLLPIITGIIGYFGGAIAAYFGIRTG